LDVLVEARKKLILYEMIGGRVEINQITRGEMMRLQVAGLLGAVTRKSFRWKET